MTTRPTTESGRKALRDAKRNLMIDQMIAEGYCRTSRKFGMVSRIDRSDWKEYMAILHSPWDWEEGMRWVNCLGEENAEDHYRRCYSVDKVEFGSYEAAKRFPGSSGTITGFREKK